MVRKKRISLYLFTILFLSYLFIHFLLLHFFLFTSHLLHHTPSQFSVNYLNRFILLIYYALSKPFYVILRDMKRYDIMLYRLV